MLKEIEEALFHLKKAEDLISEVKSKINEILVDDSATVDKIIQITCNVFDVDIRFVRNDIKNGKTVFVYPRSVCMIEIKKRFPLMSVSDITNVFGLGRSSYYHAVNLMNAPAYKNDFLQKVKTVSLILDEIFG